METMETLKQKLELAKKHSKEMLNAKYPTGLIIDVRGSQGNIFYLLGMVNDLIRELELSEEERAKLKEEMDKGSTYNDKINVMRKWFGIIFLGIDK